MALSKKLRIVLLSLPGGDVQALLLLTLSSAKGKVKKNFTSFYSIFHCLAPFVIYWQYRLLILQHFLPFDSF